MSFDIRIYHARAAELRSQSMAADPPMIQAPLEQAEVSPLSLLDISRYPVKELIRLALELDQAMNRVLHPYWSKPGVAGLCALCLLCDKMSPTLPQASLEVKSFFAKTQEIIAKSLAELKAKGPDAPIKRWINEIFEYAAGFERIPIPDATFAPVKQRLQQCPIEGQLCFRPSDGHFFVLVDNQYVAIARNTLPAGSAHRAKVQHAHIIVNEGNNDPAQAREWWNRLSQEYGETFTPTYQAPLSGYRYLNKRIRFEVISANEGLPKTNSRIAKTFQLQVVSQDLDELATKGLKPGFRDYFYHITYGECQREAFPGFNAAKDLQDLLKKGSSYSQELCALLNDEPDQKAIKGYSEAGKTLLLEGFYDEALEVYEKALTLAKRLYPQEHPDLLLFHLRHIKILFHMGNFNEAFQNLDRIQALMQQHRDPKLLARSYRWLGMIYHSKGCYEKALELEEKSLACSRQIEGVKGLYSCAKATSHLGNIIYQLGDYQKARQCQSDAYRLAQNQPSQNQPRLCGWIHINTGNICALQGERTQSIRQFKAALKLQENLLSPYHRQNIRALMHLGKAYVQAHKPDKAIQILHRVIEQCRVRPGASSALLAACYSQMGRAYESKGDYVKALSCYHQAVSIDLKTYGENHLCVAQDYHHLAQVLFKQGKSTQARDYSEKSLKILKSHQDWLRHPQRHTTQLALIRCHLACAAVEQPYDLNPALQLALELKAWNEEYLLGDISKLTPFDLIEYVEGCDLLHQLYSLTNPGESVNFLINLIDRWCKTQPLLALHWIKLGIQTCKIHRIGGKPLFDIYRLRAEVAWDQNRRHYSLRSMHKALSLHNDSALATVYGDRLKRYRENSQQSNADLFDLLEHAEECFCHIQEQYLTDLKHSRDLSEKAKNATTELLILLRNMLDMAFHRLARETVLIPKGSAQDKRLYFPIRDSVEKIRQEIPNLFNNYEFSTDIFNEFPGVEQYCRDLFKTPFIVGGKITAKIKEGLPAKEGLDPIYLPILALVFNEENINKEIKRPGEVFALLAFPPEIRQRLQDCQYIVHIRGETYKLTDKFVKFKDLPDVERPHDDPTFIKKLKAYLPFIKQRLGEVLNRISIDDPLHEEAWRQVIMEQDFHYFDPSNNQSAEHYKSAWLGTLNTIQNDSKHVRLTPQGLDSRIEQRRAGIAQRQISVQIAFCERNISPWSFVPVVEQASTALSPPQKIVLSQQLWQFLIQKGYIDERYVLDPLADQAVSLKIQKAPDKVILEAEARFFQHLKHDIHTERPEWKEVVSPLSAYLLQLAAQARNVSSDKYVNALWLINHSLRKVRTIIEKCNHVCEEHKKKPVLAKKARNAPPSHPAAAPPVPMSIEYSRPATMTQQPSLAVLKALPMQSLAEVCTFHLTLEAMASKQDGTAIELYLGAARLPETPVWLGLTYYQKALACMKRHISTFQLVSMTAAEAANYAAGRGLAFHQSQFLELAIQTYCGGHDFVQLEGLLNKSLSPSMDPDIHSEFLFCESTYADIRYDLFCVYQHPEDTFLLKQTHAKIATFAIKLRHLVDHAYTRFTFERIFKGRTIRAQNCVFPNEKDEKAMKEQICEDIHRQDPKAGIALPNYPLWADASYNPVYTAILATQSFENQPPTWWTELFDVSNSAKHQGASLPAVDILKTRKNSASTIELFYPPLGDAGKTPVLQLLSQSLKKTKELLTLFHNTQHDTSSHW